MKFLTRTLLFLLLAPLGVWAQSAAPQPQEADSPQPAMHGGHMKHIEKWWKDSETVKQLQLTDAQAQQIEQGFSDHRTRFEAGLGEVQKQEQKLQSLIDADPIDEAQINAQIDQLVAARGTLEKEHANMMLNIRKVLTLEQWRKLKSLHGSHMMGGRFMHHPGMQPPPGAPPPGEQE